MRLGMTNANKIRTSIARLRCNLFNRCFCLRGGGSIFGSKNKKKSEEFEPTFHSDPYISIVYMGLSKIGYP